MAANINFARQFLLPLAKVGISGVRSRSSLVRSAMSPPVVCSSEEEEEDLFSESGYSPVKRKLPLSSKENLSLQPSTTKKKVEEIYQKKTQLEHILLRPDTYIGSVEPLSQSMFVFDRTNKKIVSKHISFVPGLFKIFDEILVNAADNKQRDAKMSCIKVNINQEAGEISIFNDGKGIPIQVHQTEGVYVPELIFGHLLTSSNYDDADKKVTGGRNGYGAKLCNIFSTEFQVETADKEQKKLFVQKFSQNMSQKSKPAITAYSKADFTRITFKPDLEKFRMQSLDDDVVSLLEKRVYDLAGCVHGVKVYLNDELIPIHSFKEYISIYEGVNEVFMETVNERWTVALACSPEGQFQQVSFVNSICTYKGGTHVSHVTEQVTEKLLEAVKKKKKDATLKAFQVKNHISIFINCLIENPSFDSQTKENMTLKVSSFGSKCTLREEFIKKFLSKSSILEELLSFERERTNKALKKGDGHKSNRISGIPKLDDANFAGTRQAHKCTLILTEGDSAKALAVSGLAIVGRDYYGVYPLRGKLLNVRDATSKQVSENQEITQIKQIMGLQHGKQYSSVESLRYGHLMIMTDQDHDGSHIKGLIVNFLLFFWPSLMQIEGFLLEFITPIVKCTKGNQEIAFYTLPEYETWKTTHNNGKDWTIKYYKGLGTSTSQDAKMYFRSLDRHLKSFHVPSVQETAMIDMVFSKKKANERKDWLRENYSENAFIDLHSPSISYDDFVNKELILFSMADNIRSIPCVLDGLKPGQRKILYACFKRNLKGEIKVVQLSGYVSEHAAYHHGEQSLASTIVGMAQDFVGANNINILMPIGQFGTRLQGGKDAASPRYIFTSLNPLIRLIFRSEDFALLRYLNDDGFSIEPEWYIPILPMVLVNGCEGIGTGWSTSIPNYNPVDVIANLRRMIRGELPEEMHPWYKGFTGPIEHLGSGKYKISGIIQKVDDSTLEVTELPPGTWTQSYKEFLEELMVPAPNSTVEPLVKGYKEYHTDTKVRFSISISSEQALAAVEEGEGLEKKFKMSSLKSCSNLVCFSQEGTLKRYENVQSILEEFFHVRLTFYLKRKEYLTSQLELEWKILNDKARFIKDIIQGTLVIANRKKCDIIRDLNALNYAQGTDTEESAPSNTASAGNFNYLLSMPLWSLTWERVQALQEEKLKKEHELKVLLAKSPKQLWLEDLDELECELQKEIALCASSSICSPRRPVPKTKARTVKQNPKKAEIAPPVTPAAPIVVPLPKEKDEIFSLTETDTVAPKKKVQRKLTDVTVSKKPSLMDRLNAALQE